MATDSVPETSKPSTELVPIGRPSAIQVRLGLAPQTLDEAWRLAQNMAKSRLVPESFQEKPHDVLVAIQLGLEVGFAPMQALQSIAVINGRPSIWGDGFIALIMASDKYDDHDEYYEVDGVRRDGFTPADWAKDTNAAVCVFKRVGKATPVIQRFTVGMAKKAGLLGKKGPWQDYPDRMLKLRARSWAGRDAFPDVLRGLTTAEEAMDIPDTQSMRVLPMTAPQRLSQAPTQNSVSLQGKSAPSDAANVSTSAPSPRPPSAETTPVAAAPVGGVLIKDVLLNQQEQSAVVIDERGVSYGTTDRSIILAAQVAKEKGYYMEIVSERQGDESVIVELNKATATPEANGK